ncbi:MAG: BMP family lipoprotein [Candidatus Hodarchaeales archaeon]
MKKLKELSIIFVILLSIFAFSGCTAESGKKEIAIIFATGGLGDKSFNDAGYRGYLDANETYGDQINVDYVEPEDIPEFATYQNSLATEGKYDLIICVGFLQATALNDSAYDFPDQNWVIIDDASIEADNVKSITFKEHEGSFLVGAMAAMTSQTGKIGFLGGMDIFLINKFLAGYQQGAKYINSSINVTGTYMTVPPPACWYDSAVSKNIAENLFDQGIDIIYAAAGGAGQGVFQAANETDDAYGIGVDSDQDGDLPGKVLCSMLKLVETAVFNSIEEIVEGTWNSTAVSLGLQEGGVGISPMTYTTAIKNGNYVFGGVTKTRWAWIEDIIAKIKAGTIVVSDTPT